MKIFIGIKPIFKCLRLTSLINLMFEYDIQSDSELSK